MKTLLLCVALATSACSSFDHHEAIEVAHSKLTKADSGTLPNLPGNWQWHDAGDRWSAEDKQGLQVFLSTDYTLLSIRGLLKKRTVNQLDTVANAVLAANALALSATDAANFDAEIQAEIDAAWADRTVQNSENIRITFVIPQ